MCRLMTGTKNAIKAYDSTYGMLDLLIHLEKTCGGHGNGIVLYKDEKLIKTVKGTQVKVDEVYKILCVDDINYDYAIFHTRIASVGHVADNMCHPFIHNNNCMAMNGTLFELSDIANALKITDTELVFDIIKIRDFPTTVKILETLSAVFIRVS